jgi:hypothetical protein
MDNSLSWIYSLATVFLHKRSQLVERIRFVSSNPLYACPAEKKWRPKPATRAMEGKNGHRHRGVKVAIFSISISIYLHVYSLGWDSCFFSEHVFYKKCIDRQVKQDKVLFFLQKFLTFI